MKPAVAESGRQPTAATTTAQAVASAMLLGACTATPERSAPAAAYTPPAWMAQTAKHNELQGEAMVHCMAAAGYQETANPEGGVSGRMPEAASPEQAKARAEVHEAETAACYEQVEAQLGSPPRLSDAQHYIQMIDTLECLRAQGHSDLGDPPSESSWINGDPWSPYGQLYAANPDVSETEWYALKELCVEGGVTFGMSFRDEAP